jgi:hypothetical protein
MVTQLLCRASTTHISAYWGGLNDDGTVRLTPSGCSLCVGIASIRCGPSQVFMQAVVTKISVARNCYEFVGVPGRSSESSGEGRNGCADMIGTSAAQIVSLMEVGTLLASSPAPVGQEMEMSHVVR